MADGTKTYEICLIGPKKHTFKMNLLGEGGVDSMCAMITLFDDKKQRYDFLLYSKKEKINKSTDLVLICVDYEGPCDAHYTVKRLFGLISEKTSAKIYICMMIHGAAVNIAPVDSPLFCINSRGDNMYKPMETFLTNIIGKEVKGLTNNFNPYIHKCLKRRNLLKEFTRL